MKILVTGSTSRIARACLPVLLDDTRISKIAGIDVTPADIQHSKFEQHIVDIRDSSAMAQHFHNIDAVIHLAFIENNATLEHQRKNRDYIRDFNIAGSQNVFQLAVQHQVKTLLHISSAIVYGMTSENPTFIAETQPLKAVENFYYSEDKVAIELWLDEFEKRHRDIRIVRLRPHVILGQYTHPLILALLQKPVYFTFPDPQPLIQCISEMDVANAILQSLFSEAHGSFNLATDQVVSLHLVQQHLHNINLPIPYGIAKRCHEYAWRYSGRFGDPGWMTCLRYPLTIDNEKAKRDLNWRPTLDLFECLDASI